VKKKTTKKDTTQPFALRTSKIQGRGAFALRDIKKGERIIEYVGERISWKEADRRYPDEDMKRHHTFLFEVTSRTCIDAAYGGNDSRFINHSCDPNCEAIDDGGRIYIDAMRPIRKGEELTYDYAYPVNDPDEPPSLYPCRCGARTCRGTILKPEKRKKKKASKPRAKRGPARRRA
jgi:SET domain-containing protein